MFQSLRDSQSGSQPDHDTYIQDFLKWSESPHTFRIGCGGFENEEERKYIPLKKLRERLNRRSVEDLLGALFDNGERLAPDVDVIISHYLRPFAILLSIGEGRMIYQFVNHKTLEDDRLPLLQKPSEFPSSTRSDIWAAFRQEQWVFCALTLEYSMGLRIGPDEILPINHKEKIAEGGSSITYKILVDRDYDKLVPPEHADPDLQHQNTYVLKTYQTADAETYYETERDAFRRLKDDGMPPANIIGFYGGFVCPGAYNLILEYANFGNLDHYMEQTPPPSTTQEKVIFWDNFLAVINGLVKIHGEGEDNPDVFQILLGWHQDVNPYNILVKSRGAGKYDCEFKLADLGLSHFEKHMSFFRNVSTQENFGTSAYGAPEARRYDEKLQKCKLKIKQNVDIWSLSCVFSEVATWVNKGWDQLAEYRNRRIQEMELKNGKREDCFHNGFVILTAVEQSHGDIIASHRADDPITSEVVDNLIRDMLLFKEAQRPTASHVYHKSRRIIEEAKAKIRRAESPAFAATNSVPPWPIDTKSPPLKDPPNLPPNHERHRSAESALFQKPYTGPDPWVPERSPSPEDNGRVTGNSSGGARQFQVYTDYFDETYEQGISNAAHSPPLRPAPGQHRYSGRRDRGPPSSQDRYSQRPEPHTIPPNNKEKGPRQAAYDSDTPDNLSEANHMAGFYPASREREVQNRPFQALPHSASDASQEDPSRVNARRETSYPGASRSPKATASGRQGPTQIPRTPGLGLAALENQKVETQLPEMSVEEGLSLKRLGRRFPREDLFMELKARDHAFLVDNAESMKPYRNEVKMVLELLWAMVSKHDPHGADLYITTDMKALKPRTDLRVLQELDSRPAKDSPDMRHCFAQIIEKYQNQFGTRNYTSRLFHWKDTPAKGPRKLSLYVLTNGVWQTKTDLRQVIRTLVDHLIQHKLTNKQIGIQFIRFGNDERGLQRLERLDSGLNLHMDIIDTTPANGSVWKMLLGALNDRFDDDPNDEENEDENEMPHGYRNNNATLVRKGKPKDPRGQRVASGSDDHTVRLWDLQTGVSTAAEHEAGWEEESESLSDLSEVSSVQSLPSLVSDSSSASIRDKYDSKAAEHLAALLSEDSGFTSMYEAAVAKFSRERFHKNHDQLLKTFFKDLRSETRNAVQRATIRGLRSLDRRQEITLLIHNNFEPLNVNKQQAMIILRGQEPNRKQLLDDYLAKRTSALQTDSKMNLLNNLEQNKVTNLERDDESGDEVNSNRSDDDDDQQLDLDDEETYAHLEPLEIFITRSNAFARFKTNFGYLLSPPTNFSQALESRDLHVVQRFLARNFASVATSDYEWLHELNEAGYSMREIAELLLEDIGDSPWIYFTPQMRVRHRIQTTFHVPGCAHQASSNIRPQSFLCSEDHSRSPPLYTDVRRQVEELCGIGGVVPSSRDAGAWYGSVTFEDQSSLSVITYAAASTVARQSRNDLVMKISNVLANFCAAAAAVQSTGLCCDSFTFLLCVQDCLELRRIEVHHAVKMTFYINQMLQDDDTEVAVRQCVQRAESILQELRVTIPETTPNADLHYCALAAQFLCTAFLSYIQAHVGSVDPFFLDTPQRKMVLLGSQRVPGNFAISAELVELTCLADITQQMVLAFFSGATSREVLLGKGTFRYDVLANSEDFLDTWGPGYFIHSKADPSKIHAIAIGDGFVTLIDSKTSRFHWAKGALSESALQLAFEPNSMMRIGAAVSINNDCCIDEAAYRKSSFCALKPLGTHEAIWEAQERQLGFQGGQYLIGTYCQTWRKIPGTTLKQSKLQQDDWRLIDFLEQSWGLQVSFCTSVARRVSLRELVTDLLPIFVNPLKQDVWRELINAHQIIQAFTQGNLFDWLRTLSLFHQEFVFTLVRTILEQLKHTGLDRRNTNLVIAWPQEGDTGRGLKIPCKAQTWWAQVIADAEDCATFAYVTPKCLETNHLKCRGSLRAWQNASKMLVTEISLSQPQGQHLATTNAATTTTPALVTTTVATATTQWGLEDKKTYYIQKIDSLLRVKVERPSPESNDVAHLVVASSNIPQGKWKRLLLREVEKRNHRIRERQAMGDRAECVVVRAG